jgi:hypothetical protein
MDWAQALSGIGGAALGWMVGGPVGGAIGWGLGMGIGGALFPAEAERWTAQSMGPAQQLKPQANLGGVVTVLRGNRRFTGNLIWYDQPREVVTTSESDFNDWRDNCFIKVYGGTTAPQNRYYVDFAYAVCIGPARTLRLFLGKNEYVLTTYSGEWGELGYWVMQGKNECRFWRINVGVNVPPEYVNKTPLEILALVKAAGGTPCPVPFYQYQGPQVISDPMIVANKGADNVPPYRNLHYIVFKDFPITSLSDSIPQLSFEAYSLDGSNVMETDVTPQSLTNMILTNEFFGMGLDPTEYIETVKTAVAQTYATTNDTLLSIVFDNQRSVLDALQYVIQHHNGFITYENGQISHQQLQMEPEDFEDDAIAWQASAKSDSFNDNATGSQWGVLS